MSVHQISFVESKRILDTGIILYIQFLCPSWTLRESAAGTLHHELHFLVAYIQLDHRHQHEVKLSVRRWPLMSFLHWKIWPICRLNSQTECSFDGNFANFRRNIVFDLQFEWSKLQSTWASCYRFRDVFEYHLKSSLRTEILTVAHWWWTYIIIVPRRLIEGRKQLPHGRLVQNRHKS